MPTHYLFTSESTTEGHPDKLCDQISDAIVDSILHQDRTSSVAAECAVSTGIVFVAARLGTDAKIDIPEIARKVISRAGYDQDGFDVKDCTVMTSVTVAPERERRLFDERELSDEEVDQISVNSLSTAFGYACDHNPAMMPAPIWLAHQLARTHSEVRRSQGLTYLAPDAKTQVGVEYRDRRPVRIHSISMVVSQKKRHEPELEELRSDLRRQVIEPCFALESVPVDSDTRFFLNPAGPIVIGGPELHSGMTGRKTASDTYGEYARSSGSALSGKDPMRIDRVANYAARYAAKNVVAAGLALECEIQLSYSIGLAGPVGIQIDTFDTNAVPEDEIAARVAENFDFRLAAIIRDFGLRDLRGPDGVGLYESLSVFGHVGREDLELPWERTDRVEASGDRFMSRNELRVA